MIEIIIVYLIILELKTIRDIILFRFSISILTLLPKWLQQFLKGSYNNYDITMRANVFDGFHLTDGTIITGSFALMMYLKYGLITMLWTTPVFWIIFYPVLFNFNYHYVHTLKAFRDYETN